MTNGNGTGVDLTGPLAGMWRDVYRKAGEVADARAREQLKYHVYTYPHGAGDGAVGGGGGLVELGRAVATAGQVTLRVPASGVLPTGYSALRLVATGLNNSATVTSSDKVYVFFNDDTAAHYHYSYVSTTDAYGVINEGSNTDVGLHVGYAPPLDATHPQAVYGLEGTVPLHEGTALPKAGLFLSSGHFHTGSTLPWPTVTAGVYVPVPAGPITSVHLRCITDGWRAGTTFVVYGHGPATGGGGDGGGPYVDEAGDTMTGPLILNGPTLATEMLQTRVAAETANRFRMDTEGNMEWGNGGGTYDVGLNKGSSYLSLLGDFLPRTNDTSDLGGNSLAFSLVFGHVFQSRFDDGYLRIGNSVSSQGAIRLNNGAGIAWRNGTGDGNNTLTSDASNQLLYNGAPLGGGAGGTGNTTMYTQTSAPTGGANSLWFNPSESA